MPLERIEHGIDPDSLDSLRAVEIERGRPLIAVDADEVLVVFSAHLARYLETIGFEMRLTQYQLEGTIFPAGGQVPVPFDDCLRLIDRYFREETLAQQAIEGAAEALADLSRLGQIVVLTNIPRFAGPDRERNLASLGMPYPVVVNAGGKGRALSWLSAQAAAPVVFIDDSAKQLDSARKHAPEVLRVHFAGSEFIRPFLKPCPAADHRAEDWSGCQATVSRHLATAR